MTRTTKSQAAFVGCGYTAATRKLEKPEVELAVEACKMACEDAGMDPADVDGINPQVHHYPPPDTAEIVNGIGMREVRWQREGGIGIGPCGIAAQAMESGECESVLIVKIMNTSAPIMTPQIDPNSGGVAGPTQFDVPYGLGFNMQRCGLIARRYMYDYGYSEEDLGWIPVVQREHALLNPWAVMKTPITIDDYMSSRPIAEPMKLFDCDMPVNGAFAILMTREDRARDLKHRPVYLKSWAASPERGGGGGLELIGQGVDAAGGVMPWAQEIYRDAGIEPDEIDLWFPYDGWSYLVPLWMEALGLVGRGEAGTYVKGGERIRLGGEHPLNTHGGQLSEGRLHGMGHLLEATQQLRGTAGPRQAGKANTAIISSAIPLTGAAGVLSVE